MSLRIDELEKEVDRLVVQVNCYYLVLMEQKKDVDELEKKVKEEEKKNSNLRVFLRHENNDTMFVTNLYSQHFSQCVYTVYTIVFFEPCTIFSFLLFFYVR